MRHLVLLPFKITLTRRRDGLDPWKARQAVGRDRRNLVIDRGMMLHALAEGADGVQMASRFVPTVECDADDAFKKAYLDCKKGDIGLLMSPAGLPGRAIRNGEA